MKAKWNVMLFNILIKEGFYLAKHVCKVVLLRKQISRD